MLCLVVPDGGGRSARCASAPQNRLRCLVSSRSNPESSTTNPPPGMASRAGCRSPALVSAPEPPYADARPPTRSFPIHADRPIHVKGVTCRVTTSRLLVASTAGRESPHAATPRKHGAADYRAALANWMAVAAVEQVESETIPFTTALCISELRPQPSRHTNGYLFVAEQYR